jgi:hypothetical protein
MRLEHPKAVKIQQGAVLNCVVVPGYDNCNCYGIVMTARCDLEHEKHTVINYLPVVRFADWVHRGMSYLLAKRLRGSLASVIEKALTNKGVSTLVRNTFPLRDILAKETKGKDQKTLLQKCDQLDLVDTIVSLGGAFYPHTTALMQIESKQCDNIVGDLVQHKLGEYYFLDAADIYDTSAEGYVVLLRHMRTMSCRLSLRIVEGLSAEEAKTDPEAVSQLCFSHDPICMITGVLRSPDIEHLAQQFANLFVRIGLEDYADTIVEHHAIMAKG